MGSKSKRKNKKNKHKSVIPLPNITLNDQQAKAIPMLIDWYKNKRSQLFQISGAAGTGKTTVIRYLIESLGLENHEVLFVTYVGKATLAMVRNGLNASTIHKAFYDIALIVERNGEKVRVSADDVEDDGKRYRIIFTEKPRAAFDGIKLIVVDEAGMVPAALGEMMLKYGIPMIALGDLNQLPPVYGQRYFLKRPDIILTQIMRQAKDSPIIQLASDIIKGEYHFDNTRILDIGGKVMLVPCKFANDDMYRNADVVLCGTNVYRMQLNSYIREKIYGIDSLLPVEGDKVICRKNNWRRCIHDNIFLINGMVGSIENIDYEHMTSKLLTFDFKPEILKGQGDYFANVTIDREFFETPIGQRTKEQEYAARFTPGDKFEYGYAITTHLSQGSQYNNVLVDLSDMEMNQRTYIKQLYYTAVTRAIDKLTVVY